MDVFHKILKAAVDGGASDVHLKVGKPVIFRINGELVTIEAPTPSEEWISKIVEEMVPQHAKATFEKEREVDFSYFVEGVGRFRTNVFQQRTTLAIAMRYVKTLVPSFEELGLLPSVREIAEAPRGIVLVAGTTGSGKSTTLGAMIQHINDTMRRHIITLEDPIEYVFTDNESVIEQREIGLDTLSFAHGLKHVLRQDPDVIMVGEMRDATSFRAAMSAADTGHLVISTLHTTNAAQSVGRILDFFRADEREQVRKQLAETLYSVICQRMVPTLNDSVTPAMEIMINSPTIKKMILESRSDKLIAGIENSRDDGMISFDQHLFDLVKSEVISEEDAKAKATNAQGLEMQFQGVFLDTGRTIIN